jgi:hypothetical protein
MRNRKLIALCILTTAMLLCPTLAQPQEGTASSQGKVDKLAGPANPEASDHRKSIQPYRLDFSLNELDGGKKTNSRHYSMDVTAGSANEINIGTRVPVETGRVESGAAANANVNSQWQYMDVGTRIWAYLRENKDGSDDWQLEVKCEVSDIDKGAGTALAPIVRQMKFNGSTLLVTGRPIVIATMDDPNSNRQFQLEVTVTKLR